MEQGGVWRQQEGMDLEATASSRRGWIWRHFRSCTFRPLTPFLSSDICHQKLWSWTEKAHRWPQSLQKDGKLGLGCWTFATQVGCSI